ATPPGVLPEESATVSIKGRFRGADLVVATEAHVHPRGVRDYASYLGLGLVALWWLSCLAPRLRGFLRRSGDRE
ncbi:MAG: hypothetical protein AAF360_20135, partial [Pseudomonadota bacterium]